MINQTIPKELQLNNLTKILSNLFTNLPVKQLKHHHKTNNNSVFLQLLCRRHPSLNYAQPVFHKHKAYLLAANTHNILQIITLRSELNLMLLVWKQIRNQDKETGQCLYL